MPASLSIEAAPSLPADACRRLLAFARNALVRHFEPSTSLLAPAVVDEKLQGRYGCFVSLYCKGELCGCTGQVAADQAVSGQVASQALYTALHDHRFPPLSIAQLDELRIEISLLSGCRRWPGNSFAALAADLAASQPGVILREGRQSALYLPQVWRHFDSSTTFLRSLLQKGGWDADYWSPAIEVELFSVQHLVER